MSSMGLCLLALFFAESAKMKPDGIVGGAVVEQGSYPWLINRKNRCGGALIRSNWFISAGHCDFVVGEFVDFERWDMTAQEPDGQRVRIAETVTYPFYDIHDTTDEHDLQLVRLAEHVDTPLARLPYPGEIEYLEAPGTLLTVAGWGSESIGGPTMAKLRHVKIPVISNEVCGDSLHYGFYNPPHLPKKVYDTMLCAGEELGGKDSCVGDSGQPLHTVHNGDDVIVGIVSWAVGCGRAYRPGVYTRLSAYEDWINATISMRDEDTGAGFLLPSENEVQPKPSPSSKNSCAGNCGKKQEDCYCDAHCQLTGDCCVDYLKHCQSPVASISVGTASFTKQTCENFCGKKSSSDCWCEPTCVWNGDCCDDYAEVCLKAKPPSSQSSIIPPLPPLYQATPAPSPALVAVAVKDYAITYYGSCFNLCGEASSFKNGGECYCDSQCSNAGDCCDDYAKYCVAAPSEPRPLPMSKPSPLEPKPPILPPPSFDVEGTQKVVSTLKPTSFLSSVATAPMAPWWSAQPVPTAAPLQWWESAPLAPWNSYGYLSSPWNPFDSQNGVGSVVSAGETGWTG